MIKLLFLLNSVFAFASLDVCPLDLSVSYTKCLPTSCFRDYRKISNHIIGKKIPIWSIYKIKKKSNECIISVSTNYKGKTVCKIPLYAMDIFSKSLIDTKEDNYVQYYNAFSHLYNFLENDNSASGRKIIEILKDENHPIFESVKYREEFFDLLGSFSSYCSGTLSKTESEVLNLYTKRTRRNRSSLKKFIEFSKKGFTHEFKCNELKDPLSCLEFARITEVNFDLELSKRYYNRSCFYGSIKGCYLGGKLAKKRKDPLGQFQIYTYACIQGYTKYCQKGLNLSCTYSNSKEMRFFSLQLKNQLNLQLTPYCSAQK